MQNSIQQNPVMGGLQFNNTKDLKFSHDKKGVTARFKKKSFLLGSQLMSHKGVSFSEPELISIAHSVLAFECEIRELPQHSSELKNLIMASDFINDFSPFYKYVSEEVFQNYIKKGQWQLGCIAQYRTIENKQQRDEFEGFSFLHFNLNNHHVSAVCNAGFNYLIFCATSTKDSIAHKEQFGKRQLFFPSVKSFAENIKKSIGAKRYFVQRVHYNTLKSFVNPVMITNEKIPMDNRFLTPEYFDILYENMFYPALFVKPEPFSIENEIRIVFEMDKDYFKPLKFENKGLLDHIVY